MAIPSKQIGWGTESNLLWEISKQLEWINKIAGSYTSTFVPYIGAVQNVDLGSNSLTSAIVLAGAANSNTNNDVLVATGTTSFNGIDPGYSATYEELLVLASGTNWIGNNAIGYTHTVGSTVPLIGSTPIPSLAYSFYQLSWNIIGRTAGTVNIRFGNFLKTLVSASDTATFSTYGNSIPLTITPTSNFDGTIQVTVQYITPSKALLSFNNYNGVTPTFQIRSNGNNISMGVNSGTLLESSAYYNYISGNDAGLYLTAGSYNTFIGNGSGGTTSSGTFNVAVGYGSGNINPTGQNTIAIGAIANGNNIIAIGGDNNVNDSIVIGNNLMGSAIIYGNLLLGGTTNRTAKLDVTGPSLQNGNLFFSQPTPIAKVAGATLLISELLTGIITATSATAVTFALPTGTLTDAGILSGLLPNDGAFDWVVINRGSSAGAVTVTPGTAHTFVGLATIPIASQGRFRTRKISAGSYTTYRIT